MIDLATLRSPALAFQKHIREASEIGLSGVQSVELSDPTVHHLGYTVSYQFSLASVEVTLYKYLITIVCIKICNWIRNIIANF